MADKIKIVVALLLVAAGIVGFYYLQESLTVFRVLSVLVGVIFAALVFWTTEFGKRFFLFSQESVSEAKRVVWPTRKETLQTTGVVIAFAVVMALFLWAVDASLMLAVNKLLGRSD
jgi:preprotein translocase subunit SecE